LADSNDEQFPVGTVFGDRYELRASLGQGAMGLVYRVWDRLDGQELALKTLRYLDPDDVFRLKQEFRALVDLSHPNLVRLREMVSDGNSCWFTMEIIEGRDFVSWARDPATGYDALRDAVCQLGRGLRALHDVAMLHRDVKPPNVLMDTSGRIVLLDFGLVSATSSALARASQHGVIAGTFEYMAPEQAAGQILTPAADCYSAGVMLYEALVGAFPFELAAIAKADPNRVVPQPRATNPEVPADLDALCVELLQFDPAARPSADEIVTRMTASTSPHASSAVGARPARASNAPPFVGREAELGALHSALDSTRRGAASIVRIEGPSGIGKSTLIERFVAEIEDRDAALVLRSRCRAQESVRFNAFDGIVDDLSRFLNAQTLDRLDVLQPRHVDALIRIFPVLTRIPFPRAAGDALGEAEPHEIRRRGFAALRELFARIAERQALVIWIDDLQWGDLDSEPLIREVLRAPDTPAMLVVLSHRSGIEEDSALLSALEVADEAPLAGAHRMAMAPLAVEQSREVLEVLLEGHDETLLRRALENAGETAGSPFLLGELARGLVARARSPESSAEFRLGDVVADRVAALRPDERRLLELVCVSGEPLTRSLVVQSAGFEGGGAAAFDELRRAFLLRDLTRADEAVIDTYHDRIRETVMSHMRDPLRVSHHAALARSIEHGGDARPDLLARHLHGAGEDERAAEHAAIAGDRATEATAFVQAAGFYEQALLWHEHGAERQRVLRRRRADALVNGGQSSRAAPIYLEAAEGADPAQSRELRRRAAEQYLASGHLEEGLDTLRPLLRELGLRYPASSRSALGATLLRLLALRVRGFGFRQRGVEEISERDLSRIDICHAAAKGAMGVDTVRGLYFVMRGLVLSLAAGEPLRVGRGLTSVGGTLLAPAGGALGAWGARMIERSREIGEQLEEPQLIGSASVSEGQLHILEGAWREALEASDRGVELLTERCRGVDWERSFGRMGAMKALEELGEFAEVMSRAQQDLGEAIARGDLYGEVTALLYMAFGRMLEDDPKEARSLARRAIARWYDHDFLVQHIYAWRVETLCDVYEGRALEAEQRVLEGWGRLKGSNLLRVPVVRVDCLCLRARTALAAAAEGSQNGLDVAERDVKRLAGEGRDDTAGHAALLTAGIDATRSNFESATTHLEEAMRCYATLEMAVAEATARHRLAGLRQDAAQLASAQAVIRAGGIANVDRWLAVMAPGFAVAGEAADAAGRVS
jgi:tRNA A-37 threonylcarbamoyl transferase component Bud32/tetratricopeptide (TPR) repeat protein